MLTAAAAQMAALLSPDAAIDDDAARLATSSAASAGMRMDCLTSNSDLGMHPSPSACYASVARSVADASEGSATVPAPIAPASAFHAATLPPAFGPSHIEPRNGTLAPTMAGYSLDEAADIVHDTAAGGRAHATTFGLPYSVTSSPLAVIAPTSTAQPSLAASTSPVVEVPADFSRRSPSNRPPSVEPRSTMLTMTHAMRAEQQLRQPTLSDAAPIPVCVPCHATGSGTGIPGDALAEGRAAAARLRPVAASSSSADSLPPLEPLF